MTAEITSGMGETGKCRPNGTDRSSSKTLMSVPLSARNSQTNPILLKNCGITRDAFLARRGANLATGYCQISKPRDPGEASQMLLA